MTGQEHTWNSFCISYSRSVRTKYWSDTSGEHFRQAKHGHSGVSHSGLIHACWSGSTVLQCLGCFNWFNCLSWRHQTCDHAMAAVMLPCSTWRAHLNHATSNLFPPFFWITKLNTTCSIDQWTSLQPQNALNGFQSKKKSLHSTKEHPLKAQAHETCHPVCTLSTNMQKASQSFDDSRGSLP